MKQLERFCPKCGSTKGPFVKGFCQKCFLEKEEIVSLPKELCIEFCKKCNKIRLFGKWVEQTEPALIDFVRKKIKLKGVVDEKILVKLFPNEDGTTNARITVKGKIDSAEVKIEKEILLKPASGICDSCMRVSSYYHEAILQIRFKGKAVGGRVEALLKEVERLLSSEAKSDSLAKVVDVKSAKNGFDVLIGSRKAAKKVAGKLAQKFNSKVKFSFKVIGRERSGLEKKRFTFCVRV